MAEEKKIPNNCWECKRSSNCYSSYGEGTCKYKVAIEEREWKDFLRNRKGADSDAG